MKNIYILFAALIVAVPAYAAEKAGDITVAEGKVEILKVKEAVGKAAKSGYAFQTDELIRTKRKSFAEVKFTDGSIVKIYERSRLIINGIERGKDYNADIQKGRVLFDVAKMDDVNGDFKVKTTTSIIGVKGTTFAVDVQPETTSVSVKTGLVEVAKADNPEEKVLVREGQSVDVKPGKPMKVRNDGEKEALDDLGSPDSPLNTLRRGTAIADRLYQRPDDRVNMRGNLR